MGELSPEPTPASISLDNPWITKDFTETMTEVVTPAANNARDAVHYLYSLNNALRNALAPDEVLWPPVDATGLCGRPKDSVGKDNA